MVTPKLIVDTIQSNPNLFIIIYQSKNYKEFVKVLKELGTKELLDKDTYKLLKAMVQYAVNKQYITFEAKEGKEDEEKVC